MEISLGRANQFNDCMDVGDGSEGSDGDKRVSKDEWDAYVETRNDLSEEQQTALKNAFYTFDSAEQTDGYISLAELNKTLGDRSLGNWADKRIECMNNLKADLIPTTNRERS